MPSLEPTTVRPDALGARSEEADPREARTPVDLAMDRYAEGDDAAFTEIFATLAPRIQAFLYRLCGSPDLANDLAQETFLRMHRARGSFAAGHAVIPWAYAIARNCFVSHTRSSKVKAQRHSVDIADEELSTGGESNAESAVLARESAEVVKKVLAQMSVANREAFVLLRFEGLSVAAAAQILGASEGAVKLRAFRAYEALRAALKTAERSS